MYMNQIKENIACNSEYYAGILDTNIIGKQLFSLLKTIENTINYSNNKNGKKPITDGIIPFPTLNIDSFVNYFKLNFFNEPVSLVVITTEIKCKSFVLKFRLQSKHNIVINSNQYNEKEEGKEIIYQGWPVGIRNRIKNKPTKGKDTITIVYAQDIFHFTFHSTTSKVEMDLPKAKNSKSRKKNRNTEDDGEEEEEVKSVGNTCVSEDWENKSKGAFHLKLDCYDRPERKNPRTPLIKLEPHEKPYIPFVYDITRKEFLTFPAIIGKPESHHYTSKNTNAEGSNMCHDPDTLDLWYKTNNNKSFQFTYEDGRQKDYIQEVINPIFNYVVKQLNYSMKLPSDHEMSLTPLDITGNHPAPTPANCLDIPTSSDMILCKANPGYNEVVNNSKVDKLKRREATKSKETKTGGKRRTFRRKPTRSPNNRTTKQN